MNNDNVAALIKAAREVCKEMKRDGYWGAKMIAVQYLENALAAIEQPTATPEEISMNQLNALVEQNASVARFFMPDGKEISRAEWMVVRHKGGAGGSGVMIGPSSGGIPGASSSKPTTLPAGGVSEDAALTQADNSSRVAVNVQDAKRPDTQSPAREQVTEKALVAIASGLVPADECRLFADNALRALSAVKEKA